MYLDIFRSDFMCFLGVRISLTFVVGFLYVVSTCLVRVLCIYACIHLLRFYKEILYLLCIYTVILRKICVITDKTYYGIVERMSPH